MQRVVNQKALQLTLALLGLIAVLLLVGWLLPRMTTGYVLAVWAVMWLPMLVLLFRRRRVARRAWLGLYLREGSPWAGRLTGGPLMLLGQGLVAGALALALLVSLARGIPASSWIVLVLFAPVWATGWGVVANYLDRHAAPPFLPLATAGVLRWLGGGTLLLVLTIGALWQAYPDLGGVTLYEAVQFFAARQQAESVPLRYLLELGAALDGARHWLAQHWLEGVSGVLLQLSAWMLVLVQEWLFVWPFLLLCQALTHVIYRYDHRDDSQPPRA